MRGRPARGQLLTNLGVDVGSDFAISDLGPAGNANYDATFPSVEADPFLNQFLVTWQGDDDTSPLVDNEVEIFGQILSGTGVASGVNDFRISSAGADGNTLFGAMDAALVYNPLMREFLIVWEADANVNSEFEIFGHLHAELAAGPTGQPATPVFSALSASSAWGATTPSARCSRSTNGR